MATLSLHKSLELAPECHVHVVKHVSSYSGAGWASAQIAQCTSSAGSARNGRGLGQGEVGGGRSGKQNGPGRGLESAWTT